MKIERTEGGVQERGQDRGRESIESGGGGEGEIMIPKQRTAFVFIWCDCLHALLLVAVGKRGAKRGRARGRERVKEMKWGGLSEKRERNNNGE